MSHSLPLSSTHPSFHFHLYISSAPRSFPSFLLHICSLPPSSSFIVYPSTPLTVSFLFLYFSILPLLNFLPFTYPPFFPFLTLPLLFAFNLFLFNHPPFCPPSTFLYLSTLPVSHPHLSNLHLPSSPSPCILYTSFIFLFFSSTFFLNPSFPLFPILYIPTLPLLPSSFYLSILFTYPSSSLFTFLYSSTLSPLICLPLPICLY